MDVDPSEEEPEKGEADDDDASMDGGMIGRFILS